MDNQEFHGPHNWGIWDFTKRAKTDYSLRGIKTMYKKEPEKALAVADEIIKNTYRTLMTRGMKGCYVYCVDDRLAEYLRECLTDVSDNYIKLLILEFKNKVT